MVSYFNPTYSSDFSALDSRWNVSHGNQWTPDPGTTVSPNASVPDPSIVSGRLEFQANAVIGTITWPVGSPTTTMTRAFSNADINGSEGKVYSFSTNNNDIVSFELETDMSNTKPCAFICTIGDLSANYVYLTIDKDNILFEWYDNDVPSEGDTYGYGYGYTTEAYDSVAHRWIRVRFNDRVLLEGSPDGVVWTEITRSTRPLVIPQGVIYFSFSPDSSDNTHEFTAHAYMDSLSAFYTQPSTVDRSGTLPNRVVGGYWQVLGPSSHKLADIHLNYNVVFIAFAKGINSTSGALHLPTPTQGDASFRTDINTLKARGVKVILSIGGSEDIEVGGSTSSGYTLQTTTQQSAAISSLTSLIADYGFDGIDIDLEATPDYRFTVSAMANVIQSVKSIYPDLIVTLAPEYFDANNPSGQYRSLANALGANFDAIGPQYYNHGVSESQSQTDMLSLSRTLRAAYRAERVLIGTMNHDDSHSDTDNTDTNNTTTISTELAVWNTLISEDSTYRGMYIWNTYFDKNNDTNGAWAFATQLGPTILTMPAGGEPVVGVGSVSYLPQIW